MVVERIGCVDWRRLSTRAGEPHRLGGPGSPRPWWGPEGADQYRSQVVGHVVNGVPAGSRGCGWRVVHSPGGRRCLDRLPSTGTCVGSPSAWTGRARGCRPVRCPLPRWPVEGRTRSAPPARGRGGAQRRRAGTRASLADRRATACRLRVRRGHAARAQVVLLPAGRQEQVPITKPLPAAAIGGRSGTGAGIPSTGGLPRPHQGAVPNSATGRAGTRPLDPAWSGCARATGWREGSRL